MNEKKTSLEAKKGLEGFFTQEEAQSLRRNAAEAAKALGIPDAPAAARQPPPSHANALSSSREIRPPRVARRVDDEPPS